MTTAAILDKLPGRYQNGPDGRRFVWGPIQKVHRVGRYEVVEYLWDASRMGADDPGRAGHGRTSFHPFVDGKDTSRSFSSLERALLGAIAVAFDGVNTRADGYFAKMIGLG